MKLQKIKDQSNRDWELDINGKRVDSSIESLVLRHKEMDVKLLYGNRPEKYDSIIIHEPGGGGAITIPYMIHPETGSIYVGLIQTNRLTLGDGDDAKIWEVPRGFLDIGETHEQAAVRETKEEMGYEGKPFLLADRKNPNTAFFDTSGESEGVAFYALPVAWDELIEEDGKIIFPKSVTDAAEGKGAAEEIYGSCFFPIKEIIGSRDMFSAAAAGYLFLYLFG